jgi:hypothetical protein
LRTHAEAIRHALNDYNKAAEQLDPSRDWLTWEQVINTVTLADFDMLHDTQTDIQLLPWAQPAHCEASNLYFGIVCAREEIKQLNIEICHLITFMFDDHADYYHAVASNLVRNTSLAHEPSCQ